MKGQICEIGGPHVYTVEEIYEIMQNIVQFPCNFIRIPKLVQEYGPKILRNKFFNKERFIKERIDMVVNQDGSVKTLEDLGI